MPSLIALRRLLDGLYSRLAFAPPALARLVIGVVFAGSGWGKLHNLGPVTEFFASLGIPYPELQAPFVASVELIGGGLVLVGLATRFAALPLIGTMVVALATALAPKIDGLGSLFGLSEFLYIALLVQLAISGAGAASLDHLIGRALERVGGQRMTGAAARA